MFVLVLGDRVNYICRASICCGSLFFCFCAPNIAYDNNVMIKPRLKEENVYRNFSDIYSFFIFFPY